MPLVSPWPQPHSPPSLPVFLKYMGFQAPAGVSCALGTSARRSGRAAWGQWSSLPQRAQRNQLRRPHEATVQAQGPPCPWQPPGNACRSGPRTRPGRDALHLRLHRDPWCCWGSPGWLLPPTPEIPHCSVTLCHPGPGRPRVRLQGHVQGPRVSLTWIFVWLCVPTEVG